MEIVRLRLTASAATELVLAAELVGATDAVRLGLVETLVPRVTAYDRAVGIAARLGSYPREVYAHAKAALIGDALARLDMVPLDVELATAALWTAPESRAARRAQRDRLSGSGSAEAGH